MNELDEAWLQILDQAITSANHSGRADVMDYLKLKSRNDALRMASCQKLLQSFIRLSDDAFNIGIRVDIDTQTPHRFAVGNATMVGALLKFSRGVRCLTVEAGWTRTPKDGFMRNHALAFGRISHFGMSKQNAELLLLISADGAPAWFYDGSVISKAAFSESHSEQHFRLFLGD